MTVAEAHPRQSVGETSVIYGGSMGAIFFDILKRRERERSDMATLRADPSHEYQSGRDCLYRLIELAGHLLFDDFFHFCSHLLVHMNHGQFIPVFLLGVIV